jgi:hypothetical protein
MTEPKAKAQDLAAAAASTPSYGGFQSAVHALPGAAGAHIWWREIDDLPTEGERRNCRAVIEADARAYRDQGYRVELGWSDDREDADLYVYHRQDPQSSDVALLKGAAASTWLRAGWGGGS